MSTVEGLYPLSEIAERPNEVQKTAGGGGVD